MTKYTTGMHARGQSLKTSAISLSIPLDYRASALFGGTRCRQLAVCLSISLQNRASALFGGTKEQTAGSICAPSEKVHASAVCRLHRPCTCFGTT